MAIVDDPDTDLAALAGHFGGWLRRQPGCRLKAVSSLTQASRANGFSNETYRVVVSSPGGASETLILRLPPARTGLFPDYDLARQYSFMSELAQTAGLRMAACRWLETDPGALGRPFFVSDCVDGEVAPDNPSYANSGWIVDATPGQRQCLWDGCLRQLERLAAVRWQGPLLQALDWPDRGRPRFAQHLEHWTRLGAWGRRQLPDDGADPLLRELEQWLRAYRPEQELAGIVWGDARFGNVIVRDFEPAALLDWELAVVGDPMIDLAYWLFHVFLVQVLHGGPTAASRLAGFRGDAETVAQWCEQTQRTPRDYRAYWLFNAYKMLCIWQCKAALMLRTGTWSIEQALDARRGGLLRPHIGAVLEGGSDAAFLR
ncbi:MAG: phosphotransferase family protein [Rubrivivax sp.]|nr:phosphotransferase family protein [Rubrivivax sp.]